MALTPSIEITGLLKAWGGGDQAAMDRLAPLIADELRRMARHYMRGEREGHTLQATALVNEAWIRLVDATGVNLQDRAHFFAVSAQMMRPVRVVLTSAAGRRLA
jgi:RNA polymerase sigma factor (TIGR02999 family)